MSKRTFGQAFWPLATSPWQSSIWGALALGSRRAPAPTVTSAPLSSEPADMMPRGR
jgi:hypothetical protein